MGNIDPHLIPYRKVDIVETSKRKRILLVEDEPNLAFTLQYNLQAEGYDIIPAINGQIAIEKFTNDGPFDLIMLDVMLPEVDGFEVAKRIRQTDQKTGILMLTALASKRDRVTGFEAGVDDYITKPFHLEELILRVRRMIERADFFTSSTAAASKDHVLRYGPFELDTESLQLKGPNGEYTLTALETDILKEFISLPGRVLSRDHLLEKVWGVQGDIDTRTVDNFIVRLRRYLEKDPSNPEFLVSIRGRGYRLIED